MHFLSVRIAWRGLTSKSDVASAVGNVFGVVDALHAHLAARFKAQGMLGDDERINPGDDDFFAPFAIKKQGKNNMDLIFAARECHASVSAARQDVVLRARTAITFPKSVTKLWKCIEGINMDDISDDVYDTMIRMVVEECGVEHTESTDLRQLWRMSRVEKCTALLPTDEDKARFQAEVDDAHRLETMPADNTIPESLRCRNSCGFAGSDEKNGYCSLCFKKMTKN